MVYCFIVRRVEKSRALAPRAMIACFAPYCYLDVLEAQHKLVVDAISRLASHLYHALLVVVGTGVKALRVAIAPPSCQQHIQQCKRLHLRATTRGARWRARSAMMGFYHRELDGRDILCYGLNYNNNDTYHCTFVLGTFPRNLEFCIALYCIGLCYGVVLTPKLTDDPRPNRTVAKKKKNKERKNRSIKAIVHPAVIAVELYSRALNARIAFRFYSTAQ